jgi:HlyD family secretion protein
MKIPKFFNIKFKISKIWLVIIIIILIVVGYYVVKSVFKSPTEGLITEKVQKGEVLQEVSETGNVRSTEDISLGFKSVGKIAKIDVAVGDNVKRGDVLAELDSSQISAQLQSAKAALDYTASQYDSGVALAKNNLDSAYGGALNTLNSAYTSIFNAYSVVVLIHDTYFSTADQQGIAVSDAKDDINSNMQNVKNYLDIATKSSSNDDIDSAVSQMATALGNVFSDLKIIREQCDQGIYHYNVSDADKASLDTQKAYVNTVSTAVTTLQQSIASLKITLQKAEDSTVAQAQADVNALQSQLNDNYLTSPMDGIITEVNIKKGQVVSPSQSVINLLSTEPFQIKVDIYEQDIVNVKVGDDVKIDLVAFPKQTFDGKVLLIDPAETIIDNVVYYDVTIEFPNQPDGIRSGMTADITIEANKKDNVLRIPKNAVVQIDQTQTAQVVKGNKIENRTITTGLEGNDYFEVTSGLSVGDQIVTGAK